MKQYFTGLDIGGTKCVIVLASVENAGEGDKIEFIKKAVFPTKEPYETLEIFSRHIANIIREYEVQAIGISCGSPMCEMRGIIMSPPNLRGWDNIHVKDFFENRFRINTVLRNDANACALAEWRFGAGRGVSNMIFLTFGTGMGAGLILNGRLYCGANSMAGEVGHIKIKNSAIACYGIRGSFESCCSGTGIAKTAALKAQTDKRAEKLINTAGGIDEINAKIVAELARNGDSFCKKIYEECGKYLGRGIAMIADILNPERIVIGSIFERARDLLERPMWRELKKTALPQVIDHLQIVPAMLGDSVGDYAAVCAAMEAVQF